MGTKYTSQSTSGYNATPPADDGSEVASNQVFWSTIKTKLSDVLKTFAEAINSTVLTALDQSVLNTAIARTTIAGDHIRTINVTAAATQSLGDAATMATGYIVTIKNSHTAAITVDLATGTDTLNGTVAGSYSLQVGEERTFRVNSTANGYLSNLVNLSNPTVTGDITITGDILDANGNEIIELTETASAVNHLSSTNAVTTAGPTLSAVGDDTNIDLNLSAKGTGSVKSGGSFVVDSDVALHTKVINIGTWDMDATSSVNVAHELTLSKIRTISALIRNDGDTSYDDFASSQDSSASGNAGSLSAGATNITLSRTTAGFFDNTSYDTMGDDGNRGWITIQYTD